MPNSYEHSYQHDLDNVIDASDAVLAIGTEKVDTTTLKDKSLTGNDATIHGAMRVSGYFDGGRRYDGDNDYLDCGNDSSLNLGDGSKGTLVILLNSLIPWADHTNYTGLAQKGTSMGWTAGSYFIAKWTTNLKFVITNITSRNWLNIPYPSINVVHRLVLTWDSNIISGYVDGILIDSCMQTVNADHSLIESFIIGKSAGNPFTGIIMDTRVNSNGWSKAQVESDFNTLARLPLYSHNFERYPNSDTSLTSVFPYTSGIITSGSFNKTDGLKCTSAGQIVFSNSFEFDGSEYITLTINGVEYSGTTTITQGTTTATIAQGSNDITIDMGTGDVLPDIRVQFRKEV